MEISRLPELMLTYENSMDIDLLIFGVAFYAKKQTSHFERQKANKLHENLVERASAHLTDGSPGAPGVIIGPQAELATRAVRTYTEQKLVDRSVSTEDELIILSRGISFIQMLSD